MAIYDKVGHSDFGDTRLTPLKNGFLYEGFILTYIYSADLLDKSNLQHNTNALLTALVQ